MWAAGSTAVALTFYALIGAVLSGGAAAPVLVAVPAGGLVAFRAIAGATATAMPLGATRGGRWGWAVLVAGGGAALLAAGWAVLAAVVRPGLGFVVLAGAPYALVAALLLNASRLRLVAWSLLPAIVLAGSVALRLTGPDEVELRLAAAGLQRESLYVVSVPGYRPADGDHGRGLGSRAFMPEDPAAVPPYRTANVAAYDREVCRDVNSGTRLDFLPCETEADGLVYRAGADIHGYEVRRDGRTVVASGPRSVGREQLREGARTVRPAAAADLRAIGRAGEKGLYVADIPGFRLAPLLADGVQFDPVGGSGGPAAVGIMLATGQSAAQFCQGLRCETAGDLTYRHGTGSGAVEEYAGYLLARGSTTVQVTGGAAVDRAVLRDAVLAARPPTDKEILHALPPAHGRDPVAWWRSWLKEHF